MRLPERIRRVNVSSFGIPAGELTQPAQFQFDYREKSPWVSLTMDPRHSRSYNLGTLHPVFDQNLPEGYVRRYLHERLIRHANVNDLYLLALQGHKGIGHLAFESDLELVPASKMELDDILNWQGKNSLFEVLLERYYLNGLVSGVQPKVVVTIESKSVIQQEDVIVKTFDEEYPLLTVNEFVCMSAARAVGLNPPDFWLSKDLKSFVIRRFDRTEQGECLGFEDFTVLMNKSNNQKYQSSYENVLKAVQLFTKTPAEVERAYQLIVFSCLIGNGDAHLKNFAILYPAGRDTVKLSPPYDITHTLVYDTLDKNMALKLSGSKQFPARATLEDLGKKFGIKKPDEIVEALGQGILEYLARSEEVRLMTGLRESITHQVSTILSRHKGIVVPRRDKQKKFS